MPAGNLHTFFIYAFFGSIFAFSLVYMSVKFFAVQSPVQRMSLYLIALFAPLLGYGLYHTVLVKRCQSGILYDSPFWSLFDFICLLGTAALVFLGPLVAVLTVAGLGKALAGYLYLRRLRHRAVDYQGQEGQWVREVVEKRCGELGLGLPEVLFSERHGFAAFVLGFFRPVLVVGVPVLKELTYGDVEGILTHELLHIRRGDSLKGWVLHLVRGMMFFSPASSHLLGRYLLERERLCDAEAAGILGSPRGYAATLVKVWRLILEGRQDSPGLSVGFTGKKEDLEERVLSLLEGRERAGGLSRPRFFALAAAITAATVFFLGLIC